MKNRLTTALGLLLLATPAAAQWRSTTYSLKPGWNAIYLNGDATYLTPDQHFDGQPDVVEVWRWNPNPDGVQFTDQPSQPAPGTPEWSVWRRGQPQYSDLALMTGQSSYLVKLRDGAPLQTLTIKQRVEPPRTVWRRSGPNLLAFPTKKNGTQFPPVSNYFGTYPEGTASKVYRYNGGPLNAGNPVRIVTLSTERLDSTQAYWFEAKTVSDFMGPLHISTSNPAGLHFGTTGTHVTVTLRNRTAAVQTLTFAPVDSETPPAGQPAIAGPVALTRRVYNSADGTWTDSPLDAPWTMTLPAGAAAGVTFAANRAAMTGPAGSLFASILRITDAANMMDVNLPVSSGSASMAGLWVGDAELTNVESKVPGQTGTATGRPFPLRWIIHVDEAGRASLLSQAYVGVLQGVDNAVGVATSEAALKADRLGSAIRLTAAHLPLDRTIPAAGGFGPGGSITGIIGLPFNDPVNPFVHQYHPDHDNKNERFQPVPAGVESWNVSRAVTIAFPAAAPSGASAAWGSKVLTGTCTEVFTGLRKDTVTATGTITLRRVSETGVLNSSGAWVDPYTPYANNFDNGAGGAELRGSAVIADGAVRLTDNDFGQIAAVVLNGININPSIAGFTAKFKLNIGPENTPVPADGVSFAAGNLGDGPWGESGPALPNSLAVGFDTYNNGGNGNIGIHVWVNGAHITANPLNPFTNGATVPVEISYDVERGVTVKFDGATVLQNVATPGLVFPAAGRFGFGARTGGASERAVVDDVEITLR